MKLVVTFSLPKHNDLQFFPGAENIPSVFIPILQAQSGIINDDTMKDRSKEITEKLDQRHVDVCYVQEIQCRGSSDRLLMGKSIGTNFSGKTTMKAYMT